MDEPPSNIEAARAALREKHAELLSRRDRMLATKEEIERGLRRIDGELVHLVETAKMFGDELELPKAAGGLVTANVLRHLYGSVLSHQQFAGVAAKDESAPPPSTPAPSAVPLAPPPKIKQIVLDRLRAAGEKGARAAEIRQFIFTTYGIETHEKTVGMQLYRYLKAGVARREGATWFFVRPPGSKKNPAGGTAGPSDVFE